MTKLKVICLKDQIKYSTRRNQKAKQKKKKKACFSNGEVEDLKARILVFLKEI